MLPRHKRLTKTKDFMRLAVQGRSVFGPYATLRIRKTSLPEAKVGFITSTKVFKKAVDRNRVKRRMREVVRRLWSEVPAGFQLLFVLKPEAKEAKYQSLIDEVKRLLAKIPEALAKPASPSSRGKKYIQKKAAPKP
jgi:ribonuclease P protein component